MNKPHIITSKTDNALFGIDPCSLVLVTPKVSNNTKNNIKDDDDSDEDDDTCCEARKPYEYFSL